MALEDLKTSGSVNHEPLSDEERLRCAQISQIYNQSSLGGLAASTGAIILATALWYAQPHFSLIVWTLLYWVHFALHRYVVKGFRRIQPTGRDIFLWGHKHQAVTLFGGLLWGYAAIFLFPENFLHLQIFMIIFVGGIVAGGVALYSPTNEYLQNIFVALLPLAGQFFYRGGSYNMTVGGLLLMYGSIMALSGRNIHATYAEMLTLRFERHDLIEELRGEIDWRKQIEHDLVGARDELEQRVQQRTAEIAKVNEELLSEVVERRRIEGALRFSEDAYRSLSENIPGIVYRFWPSARSIKFFNKRLEQITGYYDNELTMPMNYPLETLVVSEDRNFIGMIISNAIRDNRSFEISYRIQTKSGKIRWCINYGSSGSERNAKDGYIDGVIFDITDQKVSEELIRDSEEKYRLLVDNAQEAIFVIQGGYFKFFNPRAPELLGYSSEELKLQPFENMIHPDDRERTSGIGATESKQREPLGAFRILRKDGSFLWAQTNSVGISWADEPATLNFMTDVTDIKRAEETNARTERLRAVGELASGVAHNFNNLLQIIVGSAELALTNLKNNDSAKAKVAIQRLHDSAQLGSETVKRLQSFAKIRAIKDDSELITFDLSEIVQRSIEMSRPLWRTNPERNGVKIDMRTTLVDGCFIKGNDGELFEVLLNLIKNSVEAMPSGGAITISTSIYEGEVILEVQDTGTGIHQDDFSKMFDPFWSTKGPSGTGLGLAVTHGIVKRHGGAISVHSEIGNGTSFVIRIPLSSQIADVKSVSTKALQAKNLNILIIDDTETILLILNDLLTAHDQKVFTANSGEKGIEIFLEQHIDVIISDLGMPGMTGWEVGGAIKSICEKRGMIKTPFILLTGWGGQSLEPDKISDCGIDGVLEKPIDFTRVVEMINDLIQRQKLLCAS